MRKRNKRAHETSARQKIGTDFILFLFHWLVLNILPYDHKTAIRSECKVFVRYDFWPFFFHLFAFLLFRQKSKAKWIFWLFRSSTTVRNRHGTVDRIYRTQCFLTESRPQFETHGFFSLILKYKQIESIGYTSQTMEKLTRIDKETHFDPIHVAETNRTVRSQENTCWAYRFLGK